MTEPPRDASGDGDALRSVPGLADRAMTRVVLVSPQTAENVGAVARVMMNLGWRELVLVAPRCNLDEGDAERMARFASGILEARREVQTLEEALEGIHFAFALTRHGGEDRPVDYSGFVPRPLLERHGGADRRGALVFGREDHGLTNAECSLCTARWKIPTDETGPSLNLAQAVAIALAGVAQIEDRAHPHEPDASAEAPATLDEVHGLIEHLDRVMEASNFERGRPRSQPLDAMRRAASRAHLTRSEVRTLRGVCRRVLNAILGNERRP